MATPARKPRLPFDPVDEARRQWKAHGWVKAADGMAAVTSIMRVQQVFLAAVDVQLKPLGLTFARYEVLALLSFTKSGALPLGKIGTRLQVHPASVTSAVDRLERDGHVRRERHSTDGRMMLARITPAGRSTASRATRRLNRDVFERIGLDDAQARNLFSLLETVRRHAGDIA